jgi:cell division protein ZapA (FtsZ GTPase activity inhibitor)
VPIVKINEDQYDSDLQSIAAIELLFELAQKDEQIASLKDHLAKQKRIRKKLAVSAFNAIEPAKIKSSYSKPNHCIT